VQVLQEAETKVPRGQAENTFAFELLLAYAELQRVSKSNYFDRQEMKQMRY